jgi:hypothetical protein
VGVESSGNGVATGLVASDAITVTADGKLSTLVSKDTGAGATSLAARAPRAATPRFLAGGI